MVTWMLIRVTQLDVQDGRPVQEESIDLFRYRTTYTVGRAVSCNLRMLSNLVSRLHGELRLLGNTVFIKDFKSSNGTYVNQHKILPDRELSLHEGDRIGFGSNIVMGPESFVFTLVRSDSRPVECILLSSDDEDEKVQEQNSSQPPLQAPHIELQKESLRSPECMGSFSDVSACCKRHLPDECRIPRKLQSCLERVHNSTTSTSYIQRSVEPCYALLAKPVTTGSYMPVAEMVLSNPVILGNFSHSQTPLSTPLVSHELFSVNNSNIVSPSFALPVVASNSLQRTDQVCSAPTAPPFVTPSSLQRTRQLVPTSTSLPAVILGSLQFPNQFVSTSTVFPSETSSSLQPANQSVSAPSVQTVVSSGSLQPVNQSVIASASTAPLVSFTSLQPTCQSVSGNTAPPVINDSTVQPANQSVSATTALPLTSTSLQTTCQLVSGTTALPVINSSSVQSAEQSFSISSALPVVTCGSLQNANPSVSASTAQLVLTSCSLHPASETVSTPITWPVKTTDTLQLANQSVSISTARCAVTSSTVSHINQSVSGSAALPVVTSCCLQPANDTHPSLTECHRPDAITCSQQSVTESKPECTVEHSVPVIPFSCSHSLPVSKADLVCSQPALVTCCSPVLTESAQVCVAGHSRPAVISCCLQSLQVSKPAEVEHSQPTMVARCSQSATDPLPVGRVEHPQTAVDTCSSISELHANSKAEGGLDPLQSNESVVINTHKAVTVAENSSSAISSSTVVSVCTMPVVSHPECPPCVVVLTKSSVIDRKTSTLPAQKKKKLSVPAVIDRKTLTLPAQNKKKRLPVPTVIDRKTLTLPAQNKKKRLPVPAVIDRKTLTLPAQNKKKRLPVPAVIDRKTLTLPAQNKKKRLPVPAVIDRKTLTLPAQNKKKRLPVPVSSAPVTCVPLSVLPQASDEGAPVTSSPLVTCVNPQPSVDNLHVRASYSPPAAVASSPPRISLPSTKECSLTETSLSPTHSSSAACRSTSPDLFLADKDLVEVKSTVVKLEFPQNMFSEDEIITISDDEAYPSSQLFEETETNEPETESKSGLEDESDSFDHFLFMGLHGDDNDLHPSVSNNAVFNEQDINGDRNMFEAECVVIDDVNDVVSADQPSISGDVDKKSSLETTATEKRHKRKSTKPLKRPSAVEEVSKSKTKKDVQEKPKPLREKLNTASSQKLKKRHSTKSETVHKKSKTKGSANKKSKETAPLAKQPEKCNMLPGKVVPVNVKVTDKNRSAMLTEAICASVERPKGRTKTTPRKIKDVKEDVKKIIEFKNKLHCPPVQPQSSFQPQSPLQTLEEQDNVGRKPKRIPKLSFKDIENSLSSVPVPAALVPSTCVTPVVSHPSTLISYPLTRAHVPSESPASAVPQEKPKKSVRFREGSELELVHTIPALTREERATVSLHGGPFRREISANLEDVIQEICSWKTSWFRGLNTGMFLPPTTDPKSLLPMLDFFKTHEDYRNIVERLMFCELWEMVSRESQEKQSFHFIVVDSVRKVVRHDVQLMDIYCHTLLQSRRRGVATQLREGHLVAVELILEKSSEAISYSQSLSQSGSGRRFCEVIGFVTQAQFLPITAHSVSAGILSKCVPKADLMLNLRVRTGYRDFDLRLHDAMRLRPLCYIRVMLLAFRAIRELKNSPLCSIILNPKKEHFRMPPVTEKLYMQGSLNEYQQEAVLEAAQICCSSGGQDICLIQGPPGTGKSHVIVSLVIQLLYGGSRRMGPKPRILLCAHSNAAVDELVRRLMYIRRTLGERQKMKLVRFGQMETMHPEVQTCSVQAIARRNLDETMRKSGANSAQRSLDENIRMLSQDLAALQKLAHPLPEDEHRKGYLISRLNALKNAQKDSTFQKEMCQAEKAERLRVVSGAEVVCTTIGSCFSPEMEDFFRRDESTMKYSCCIIDEATKCWEPETLVPLLLKVGKLVLVGDPAQLQGIVHSSLAKKLGFEKSLFERISSCVSTLHPSPVKFLSLQYRMHPAISYWPNKYFYSGLLRDAAVHLRPCPLKPYIVLALGYTQDVMRENTEEAEFVVQLALTVREQVDATFSVGIITPYNQQKQAITQLLQRNGCKRQLTVDVIDGVQGQERDVVLVSMVRTDGVGFLSNESRLNVALTRARHSLIVCGNFTSLKGLKAWEDLLQDARERHLFLKVSEKLANRQVYLKSLIMASNNS